VRKLTRTNQHQFAQAHVLHRARHRADIARMRRLDQNEADVDGIHLLGFNHAAAFAQYRRQGRTESRRSHHPQGSQEGLIGSSAFGDTQMNKNTARLRRAKSTRAHIRELGVPRLSVLRTGQHLYAQVFTADGSKVLASASTVQSDVKEGLKNGKNADAAAKVGRIIAEKAKAAGVEKVAFDRSGYRYHGRIKALADAAREGGLQF
jgi:large subunit ribosomal protein L18